VAVVAEVDDEGALDGLHGDCRPSSCRQPILAGEWAAGPSDADRVPDESGSRLGSRLYLSALQLPTGPLT